MITLYDPQQHRSALVYGVDMGVVGRAMAAFVLWMLGYPDQALERIRAALTLAQELAHPQSVANALNFAAMFHQFRRERQTAQERVEAAMTLSTEQGFPLWLAWGTILRGWAPAAQGQGEEGIAQMRQGLAACRATGVEVWRPYFLALLAEVYGKVGQTEEGLTVLTKALTTAHKTGERWYEAELYRLKGELLLAQEGSRLQAVGFRAKTEEAETCFWRAIEIARKQQAKSWELRAATSLARLWQQQGKQKEAHEMLAEIYNWFTEGFDTADLKEAKAVLAALNH